MAKVGGVGVSMLMALPVVSVEGADAPLVRFRYSEDGTHWHTVYAGGDFFFSNSVDAGVTWSDPIRFWAEPLPPGQYGFNWIQSTPADTWTIPHNLGYFPSVDTFSVGGVEMIGAVIHLTDHVTQISFNVAVAGTARLS